MALVSIILGGDLQCGRRLPRGNGGMVERNLNVWADSEGVWLSAESGDFTLATVTEFLRSKGVRKYNEKVIAEFVREKNLSPQKIAERDPAAEKDAAVVVHLDKDKMTASVVIEPPFFMNPWPSRIDVLEALEQKNVVFGVDEIIIEKLTELKLHNEHVVVATGKQPLNGDDARIELLLDPDQVPAVDYGVEKVDHRERSVFINVKQGDKIAVKHPATQGENGTTVVGTDVSPIAGKDVAFPIASGLEVSEDGLLLTAAIGGRLFRKNNKLSVLPELEIMGDVDFSVGNVDFKGYVKIWGSVRDGFRVLASNGIEIKQMVEGGVVESAADIVITGGVQGTGKGHIIAAGNITANFINQAYVRSSGDVKIVNSILHSDVSANQTVTVMGGRKSQIIGGRIQAELGVLCNILGSEIGTKTEIIVGLPPFLNERRKELYDLIAKHTESLEALEADLTYLKRQELFGALNEKQRSLLVTTIKSKYQLQATLKSNQDELDDISNRMALTQTQGTVKVKDVCYPGVTVAIRDAKLTVRETFKNVTFVYDKESAEVKLRPF